MVLSLVSVNVRSIKDPVKRLSVLDFLKNRKGDIFLLQECWIPYQDNYCKYEEMWDSGLSVWSGDNSNRAAGVAILFKGKGFDIRAIRRVVDGRLLVVDVDWCGVKVRLINVYCPVDLPERLDLLSRLSPLLVCNFNIIIGGDFNCLISKKDRKSQTEFYLDSSSRVLQTIIEDFHLKDVFGVRVSDSDFFTWSSSNFSVRSRIDYCLISKDIKVEDFNLHPVFFSDHSLLYTELDIQAKTNFGKGVWKLNVLLLKEEKIVQRFRGMYRNWQTVKCLYNSVGEWWEDVKKRVKVFFINEGRKIAKGERYKLGKLQGKLQRLYIMLRDGFDVANDITITKMKMSKLYRSFSRSIIFRSRVRYCEENEKCTRFFFKKMNPGKKAIHSLFDINGVEQSSSEAVLGCAKSFYEELYDVKEIEGSWLEFYLSKIDVKLSDTERQKLEKEISLEELGRAVKSFKKNKVPGIDGLPIEFYDLFWDLVGGDLLDVYNESWAKGVLISTMREGCISLLYKKGDKKEIKNWRPVTLLCVDLKILSKVVFLRLQSVIASVVNSDQTCGIPGRLLTDNLALVRDIIEYVKDRNVPLCLLSLDQEKAFDRLNHSFIMLILVKMNFGPAFCSWIHLLYKDCFSRIIINGVLSEPFKVLSGVRQGCPLSPLLFVLGMEPLACAIRQDSGIAGIIAPGSGKQDIKVTLYMDDITVFCSDNASVTKVFWHCDKFALASSSKINMGKSECWYVNWKEAKIDFGLVEKYDFIKILGVLFGPNMSSKNWEGRIARIKQKLGMWGMRELTLSGRILVIKTEVLSSLVFLASIFPIPRQCLFVIQRAMFQFLWGSKCEKVKRQIMYKTLNCGGKNVPDLGEKIALYFCDLCG